MVKIGVNGGLGLHGDRAYLDLSRRTHLTIDLVQDLDQVLMFLLG